MKIQVLGTGCAKCDLLYKNTLEAAKSVDPSIIIEKVADPHVFLKLKVFMTPALVIDDQVIAVGKVLDVDQIQSCISNRMSGE
jgi:small redox-active disulfide protein 2